MEDRSITFERANLLAIALVPIVALFVFGPPMLLGEAEIVWQGWSMFVHPLTSLALLGSIVIHEGLHAVGFLLGGAPRQSIHFGIHWKTLSPYASCRVPVAAGTYRLAVVLPALVLGVVPWGTGLLFDKGFALVFAFWMLAFAGGDLIVLWLIRDLPSETLVIDHPERVGCRIVLVHEHDRP